MGGSLAVGDMVGSNIGLVRAGFEDCSVNLSVVGSAEIALSQLQPDSAPPGEVCCRS